MPLTNPLIVEIYEVVANKHRYVTDVQSYTFPEDVDPELVEEHELWLKVSTFAPYTNHPPTPGFMPLVGTGIGKVYHGRLGSRPQLLDVDYQPTLPEAWGRLCHRQYLCLHIVYHLTQAISKMGYKCKYTGVTFSPHSSVELALNVVDRLVLQARRVGQVPFDETLQFWTQCTQYVRAMTTNFEDVANLHFAGGPITYDQRMTFAAHGIYESILDSRPLSGVSTLFDFVSGFELSITPDYAP